MHSRGEKTKQLLALTMANHNPQETYKAGFWSADETVSEEGTFLGMNTIPSVPQLGVQHLLAATVKNSSWAIGISQRCHGEAFHGLLALGMSSLRLGASSGWCGSVG